MDYPTTLFGYQQIGTLREEMAVQVQIAALPKREGTQYIINAIDVGPQTIPLFEQCLQCFSEKIYPDFLSFFSEAGRFFLVFPNHKAFNLRMGFQGNPDEVSIGKRFALLHEILLKLHEACRLPLAVVIGAATPENIHIDPKGDVHLQFLLESKLVLEEVDGSMLYERIASIIALLLEQELESRTNQKLRIIIEKCEKHLYQSIPELIKELENAEETCSATEHHNWMAELYQRYQKQIQKAAGIASVGLTVGVLLYLSLSLFSASDTNPLHEKVLRIGNQTYVADESAASTLAPSVQQQTASDPAEASTQLTGEQIAFEDHVVRSGETLDAICETYYGNAAYREAVAAYNNMPQDTQLQAGTILKLPNPENIVVD